MEYEQSNAPHPNLPKPVKGWDINTQQFLYFYLHELPHGQFRIWYDENGNYVHHTFDK